MKDRDLLLYSLLRRECDSRPRWMIVLGIYSLILNEVEISSNYPRLRYKKKYGSFCVHKHADEKYKEQEESRYESYLKELKEIAK